MMLKFVNVLSWSSLLLIIFDLVNGQNDQICQTSTKINVWPHEKFCDFYYRCDRSNQSALRKCPNGLVFAGYRRGFLNSCDYPFKVGCPNDNLVIGQSPIATPNCPWSFGVFAHETSCTRYWQCWNGTATLQMCPYSLLYNERLHSCDWPTNVPECQKHPICKNTPNGMVAMKNSCTRFWLCIGGYPRIQLCPAGMAFNEQTNKCDLDYNVPGCEPPSSNSLDSGLNNTSDNRITDPNRDSSFA